MLGSGSDICGAPSFSAPSVQRDQLINHQRTEEDKRVFGSAQMQLVLNSEPPNVKNTKLQLKSPVRIQTSAATLWSDAAHTPKPDPGPNLSKPRYLQVLQNLLGSLNSLG